MKNAKGKASGGAWAIQHHSGRICLGSELEPQIFYNRRRARERAAALKMVIGRCRVVRVRYRIVVTSKTRS